MTAVTALRKPYVTPYAEENRDLPLTFEWAAEAGGLRLAYHDPVEQDRMFGVLWVRCGIAPGRRVLWRRIHPPI
ncbi:hypothetical protein [Planomonospora algeriensis]